ncbi:MAG: hypothetical protein F4X51_16005 [Gemmatimonadetes bacterium]|nr:hypothetical protein [Gemmatimonadota bacterium]
MKILSNIEFYKKNYIAVGLFSVLFAVSFGLSYGFGDQAIYLLPGMQLYDPTFLARDWYVSEIVHYHVVFKYLVYLLMHLGALEWSSSILNLGLMVWVGFSIYRLLGGLYQQTIVPFLLTLVLLHLMVNTDILSHRFLPNWLIPNGIATVCFLGALAELVDLDRRRKLHLFLSGLFFGLSVVIHSAYLFFLLPFFVGISFCLRQSFNRNDVFIFALPFCLLALPLGIKVYAQFIFPAVGEIDRLDAIARLRIPHHYLAENWGQDIMLPFFVYLALGICGLLLHWPKGHHATVVLYSAAVMLIGLIFVFLTTVLTFIPQIALLQGYRFGGLLSFLCFLFFAGGIGQVLIDKNFDSRRLVLLCISVGLVYLLDFYFAIGLLLFLNVCFILDLMSSTQVYERVYKMFILLISVCFLAFSLQSNFPISRTELLHQGQKASLYKWVRTHTDKDALFVVPVDRMTQFRLFAQRAIVIDWKGCPYFPSEYDVWLKRLQDVTGSTELGVRKMRDQGYRELDSVRAQFLLDAYNVQYVVMSLRQRNNIRLRPFDLVYAKDGYAIYRLQSKL